MQPGLSVVKNAQPLQVWNYSFRLSRASRRLLKLRMFFYLRRYDERSRVVVVVLVDVFVATKFSGIVILWKIFKVN